MSTVNSHSNWTIVTRSNKRKQNAALNSSSSPTAISQDNSSITSTNSDHFISIAPPEITIPQNQLPNHTSQSISTTNVQSNSTFQQITNITSQSNIAVTNAQVPSHEITNSIRAPSSSPTHRITALINLVQQQEHTHQLSTQNLSTSHNNNIDSSINHTTTNTARRSSASITNLNPNTSSLSQRARRTTTNSNPRTRRTATNSNSPTIRNPRNRLGHQSSSASTNSTILTRPVTTTSIQNNQSNSSVHQPLNTSQQHQNTPYCIAPPNMFNLQDNWQIIKDYDLTLLGRYRLFTYKKIYYFSDSTR